MGFESQSQVYGQSMCGWGRDRNQWRRVDPGLNTAISTLSACSGPIGDPLRPVRDHASQWQRLRPSAAPIIGGLNEGPGTPEPSLLNSEFELYVHKC
jgi:hypothetical protein